MFCILFFAASPKAGVSPQPTKTVIRMKTLQEEQHVRETKPLLINETEDVCINNMTHLTILPLKFKFDGEFL